MNKATLILKYFQKKDLLTVQNRQYQKTISSLFRWLTDNDHVNDDQTSKFFPNKNCNAQIISKDQGIIAGLEEIEYLLKKFTKLIFKPKISDGREFKEKDTIAQISGKSHEILAYERTILNILQRMSGIATQTNLLINLINLQLTTHNSQPFIAATRKTPWMSLDKKAVAVGGGLTHRLNLSDGILIKDNHLALISKAIKTPREWLKAIEKAVKTRPARWPEYKDSSRGFIPRNSPGVEETGRLIEIEVESEYQAHQVIKTFLQLTTHNPQLITHNYLALLLDNFSPSRAKSLLNNLSHLGNVTDIIFEASGDINENNIVEWSKTGIDILSLGSLTHSTNAENLSLEF